MEMIKMCVIQDYRGKDDEKDLFLWDEIMVPRHKEEFIASINERIPSLFELEEPDRQASIGTLVLLKNNDGINQYFPFLREYAPKEVAELISMVSGPNVIRSDNYQKVK